MCKDAIELKIILFQTLLLSMLSVKAVHINANFRSYPPRASWNYFDRSDKSHMATWELGVKAPADESQCCEMLVVRSHRASLVGSRI